MPVLFLRLGVVEPILVRVFNVFERGNFSTKLCLLPVLVDLCVAF